MGKELRFLSAFLSGVICAMPVMADNCDNEIYRRYNPDKCVSVDTDSGLSFATTAAIAGGALAAIGGTVAIIGLSSSNDSNHSSASTVIPAKSPTMSTTYNLVGNDVDNITLSAIRNNSEYIRNNNQYEDIRAAYSLARGYTGAGSNVAVFDFGKNTWHGGNVAYLSSGQIAPNAHVASYQITDQHGNFYSFNKIGETINTATAQNANVYNFSWEITNVSASQVKNRQHMINLTSRGFVNSLINAVEQNDAILVWAAGNGYNSESSALSALPLHITQLNGHFVNVVAWDSNLGTLADFSNGCGITQNYCITAPGVALDSPKTATPLDGTSFAAPIVSAAISVIREAFPYMTSPEITQLLFTTARDLGDAGIDAVYGHGMLDLERATRPVGAALVPLADGTRVELQTARVGGTIGHKIKSQNIQFAFVDSFGRAFATQLNDSISIKNRGIGYERLTEQYNQSIELGNIEFGFRANNLFQGSGFLATDTNPTTTFIGYKNDIQIGNTTLFQKWTIGMTKPTPATESMINGFSNISTATAQIGARYGDWALSVGIPETILSGNMYLNTPTGRRANGEYTYHNHKIDLAGAPAVEYSATYKFITAGFVDNPYGTDEIYALARGTVKF